MKKVVYVTRTGLLEPLGQSQILSYLRGLARDYAIVLMTCEKPVDWQDQAAMARAKSQCEALGIDWRPRVFRTTGGTLGHMQDLAGMFRDSLRAARREGTALIHARSYLPAAIAWCVWKLTRTPFLFDMRALWPEERIAAGRIRRGSPTHRVVTAVESRCLRDAAAIVSLTQAAADHLRATQPAAVADKPVTVIPTCADLSRFKPVGAGSPGGRVHGCIGTVLSGWFLTEWLATWFEFVARVEPDANFEIVTRDDEAHVRAAVDRGGRLGGRLSIKARAPSDMPQVLREHSTSAVFYGGGLGDIGRSPTRMAEVLGTGIPVISNEGVGDVSHILKAHRVGVVATGGDRNSMAAAYEELCRLQQDPDLPARCRQTAEALFSLENGTEAYRRLYRHILGERDDGKGAGA